MLSQQYKGGLLLLLIFLFSMWAVNNEPDEQVKQETRQRVEHSIDHFAENYSKLTLDKSGEPANKLTAKLVKHFSDTDETELTTAVLIVNKGDLPPWKIRSEKALLADDGSAIFMQGKVFIDREAVKNVRGVHIKTSELHIQPKKDYAETAEWAELVTGLNTLSGVGLKLVYKDPIYIELLADVKGKHVYK
ncbi:MAG: LPS export ABC transporter periplasmic protein LptC [Methyloprofundus sp.]|nr:LPS export ABC transporter periplasmic protein LptC [Methyloprofundus sp.]